MSKTLDENKIPDIKEVVIIEQGKGIRIQFGNHTHFIDKRDLFNLPTWNDRDDNRATILKRIQEKKK